jgi:hypothetical protein
METTNTPATQAQTCKDCGHGMQELELFFNDGQCDPCRRAEDEHYADADIADTEYDADHE